MHPTIAQYVSDARRADVARHVTAIQRRPQPRRRPRARPPSPGRLRLATARTLAGAAQRLVPDESLDDLRHHREVVFDAARHA